MSIIHILSSQSSLKFARKGKIQGLSDLVDEYKKVCSFFVEELWPLNLKDIPSLLPIEMTSKADTWLSARLVQSAAKQSSGIVRGTKAKQARHLAQISLLKSKGMYKRVRKLQAVYDRSKVTKPDLKSCCPELDSRFVKTDIDSQTSMCWITLSSLAKASSPRKGMKLVLPFKKTEHFNKMLASGNLKEGARISKSAATFMFKMNEIPEQKEGKVLGIDIGIKSVFSASDGQQSVDDVHGWNLDKIQNKICVKTKGSKAFLRCQRHRKNHINWCLNGVDLTGVKRLNIERIKNLRTGKKTSRYLSHWTYADISDKLGRLSHESGVPIHEMDPAFTSQRCSICGWTRKSNRHRKRFRCTACGYASDADLNASVNISLDLPEISRKERLSRPNLKGFYWVEIGQKRIVHAIQKAS